MSVVRIIEGPYYRGYFYNECMGIFPRPSELSILERCRKERFYCILLTQGEIQCHDFQPQRRIQYSQNDETSCENAGYNYPIPMLKKDFVSNSNWTKSSTIQGVNRQVD